MNLLRRGSARRTLGSRRTLSTGTNQEEEQRQAQAEEGNITRQNFWRSLESFKAHLGTADFVGFDLELSGIHSVLPSECFYHRIKHLAEKFAVFQVGLALFHLDPACNRFLTYPYNFYVFPRNELSLGLPATTFSCEASALEFLASHGFDFNLCIQDGISYLSKTQESEARVQLANEHVPFRLKSSRSLNKTSDVVFAERLRVDLEKWHSKITTCSLDLNSHGGDLAADILSFKLMNGYLIKDFKVPYHGVLSKCPSITLQLENHHEVCLAQLVVDKHFKDLVFAVRRDCMSGASHNVEIFFTKSKEYYDIIKRELEQGCEQPKINEAIGFRHIVDAIVSSQKPLIGHNCALDLAHIHNKFLSPLPSSAEEFSVSLLAHFPTIIDTKYLMKFVPSLRSSWKKKHTSLNAVYSYLCQSKDTRAGTTRFAGGKNQLFPKAQIDIVAGFKRYQDNDSNLVHEAGYDAFMTGCVFAQICHQLSVNVKDLLNPRASPIEEFTNLLNFGHGILDLRTGKLRELGAEVKNLDQILNKSKKGLKKLGISSFSERRG